MRFNHLYAKDLLLRIIHSPAKIPAMREWMLWHRTMDRAPMHQWLLERILRVHSGAK